MQVEWPEKVVVTSIEMDCSRIHEIILEQALRNAGSHNQVPDEYKEMDRKVRQYVKEHPSLNVEELKQGLIKDLGINPLIAAWYVV